ncbi:MAG: hydroxypyruvate isomerase [Gammaproteobacteria bacterium]|jgi:hydroxypyruvate isomerase
MPNLAANISMMYTEVPFLERFALAAANGFRGVEFLFPYEHPAPVIASALQEHNLQNVLFNLPPGNWEKGERGLAGMPGREAEFGAALEQALEYARVLNCPRVHAMHGVPSEHDDPQRCRALYIENLRMAARRAAEQGINVLIEPLNPRDVPGYPLNYQHDAQAVVRAVGEPNLKIQFDMYHCQIVEGDVTRTFQSVREDVDHIQIAGVPQRHEPSVGEARYEYLLQMLDDTGYAGWVGCEYRPATNTADGLGWADAYGITSA